MNAYRKNMLVSAAAFQAAVSIYFTRCAGFAFLCWAFGSLALAADTTSAARSITKLPAGTPVVDHSATAAWNRVVLIAKPQISSGDTSVLSSTIRDAATQCSLTVMARVAPPNADSPKYQLMSVGVGFSAKGETGPVIVTAESASRLRVPIGFIGRQILRQNEEQLEKVQLITSTSTLALFDAPTVMLLNGNHVKTITRHLIWIDANSGQGAALAWLLHSSGPAARVVNYPIRAFSFNTQEDRKIHVDGDEFGLFGIPSEMAMALEDLPPGTDVAWTKAASAVAARSGYTLLQITELATAMNHAMTLAKVSSSSNRQ